jgi:hypothetical protein
MDALATLLIQLDVTPSKIADISRASFVKATASLAQKKRSGRPHIARVAALTGLSRSEVKKLIVANYSQASSRPDHLPRPLKVLAAWKTSPRYCRHGKAMTLKVSGRAPSFESLCREFSGDIPHRTIATELLLRNLIQIRRVGKKDHFCVIRAPAQRPSAAHDTLSYLASLLEALVSPDRLLVRQKSSIATPKNLSAPYFQNSIVERVTSFVDELPMVSAAQNRRPGRGAGLEVFAIVSRGTKDL